ncbi:regulator of telomere elongation helicase 1 like protein [Quercus suber]|uniref:Regulator of telomere elongation helicase 1 like protein n=1 Tax=Quercus suber TaxID=58331 RepID=A0AAW0KTH3_QUESU
MLTNIIDDAAVLLEEENHNNAKGTVCRLESINDILHIILEIRAMLMQNFIVHVQELEASAADGLKGNLEIFAVVWDRSYLLYMCVWCVCFILYYVLISLYLAY